MPSFVESRSVGIFVAYLSVCLIITCLIIKSLYDAYERCIRSNRGQLRGLSILLFSVLSALSLGITWYYMLSFFSHSYREWASQAKLDVPINIGGIGGVISTTRPFHFLGLWLRDTQLFKEAWETASNTREKFWWTQPIFFATTAWSVFLEQRGRLHKVSRPWMFMLLGQIMAISFAMNLFYLAVLLNPSEDRTAKTTKGKNHNYPVPSLKAYAILLISILGSILCIPAAANTSYFLSALFITHVLVFLPPFFDSMLPDSLWIRYKTKYEADHTYRVILGSIVALGILVQARATTSILENHLPRTMENILKYLPQYSSFGKGGMERLSSALYEHPAVTSVGWDGILCCVSSVAWTMFGN